MFSFKNDSALRQLFALVALILLGLAVFMGLGALLGLLFYGNDMLIAIQTGIFVSNEELNFLKLLQGMSHTGMFVVPSFVYAWLSGTDKYKYLSINILPNGQMVLMVILLLLVSTPVIGLTIEWNSKLILPEFMSPIEDWMRESEEKAMLLTNKILSTTSFTALIANIFILAILPAVGEEFLFRGVLMRVFSGFIKNIHVNIVLTAILFSALHLQFFGFLPRFLLGVALGYLLVWSGSLWLPIIFHFLNNAFAVLINYFYSKGFITANPETFGTFENQIVVLIPLIMVAGIFYWFHSKRNSIYQTSL